MKAAQNLDMFTNAQMLLGQSTQSRIALIDLVVMTALKEGAFIIWQKHLVEEALATQAKPVKAGGPGLLPPRSRTLSENISIPFLGMKKTVMSIFMSYLIVVTATVERTSPVTMEI